MDKERVRVHGWETAIPSLRGMRQARPLGSHDRRELRGLPPPQARARALQAADVEDPQKQKDKDNEKEKGKGSPAEPADALESCLGGLISRNPCRADCLDVFVDNVEEESVDAECGQCCGVMVMATVGKMVNGKPNSNTETNRPQDVRKLQESHVSLGAR